MAKGGASKKPPARARRVKPPVDPPDKTSLLIAANANVVGERAAQIAKELYPDAEFQELFVLTVVRTPEGQQFVWAGTTGDWMPAVACARTWERSVLGRLSL